MGKINKQFFTDVLKSVVLSLIISAVLVLGLSLLMGFVSIEENVLIGINQGIKAVSLLFGCIAGYKEKKAGFLKGILTGLLFAVFSWLIYGLTSSTLTFTSSTAVDMALTTLMGLLAGIIAVFFRKK